MLHRIRLAMREDGIVMAREVEVDETFVGGKVGFMKRDAREPRGITRRGGLGQHKTAVMGFKDRGTGRVQAQVIPNAKGDTLKPIVAEKIEPGSTVCTDQWNGYTGLEGRYTHETINHVERYVEGRVHTNGIENFWALLARSQRHLRQHQPRVSVPLRRRARFHVQRARSDGPRPFLNGAGPDRRTPSLSQRDPRRWRGRRRS